MNEANYNGNNTDLSKLKNNKTKEKNVNPKQNNKNNNDEKIVNEKSELTQKINNCQEDIINLNAINDEYDIYITNLKEKLSIVKEERKRTENEFNTIKHRLILLKNQEKTNNINFQNIRYRFKKILNNRLESQQRIKKKLNKTTNYNSKKKINKNKYSHTPKRSVKLSRTYNNNFYPIPSPASNIVRSKIEKNINNDHNKNSIDYNEEEIGKNKLKEKLMEKLKEDQEEKRRIEEEIAKIEQEEFLLLNAFKKDKIENNF